MFEAFVRRDRCRGRSVWIAFALLVLAWGVVLFACASERSITRLDDGSYQLRCDDTLQSCLRQLEGVCRHGYEVASAKDERSVYGEQTMQSESHRSEAVARCLAPKSLFGGSDPNANKASDAGVQPEPPSPSSTPRACVPGSTQKCLGVGGCRGSQRCLVDGSTFEPCECTPVARPSSEPPPKDAGSVPEDGEAQIPPTEAGDAAPSPPVPAPPPSDPALVPAPPDPAPAPPPPSSEP